MKVVLVGLVNDTKGEIQRYNILDIDDGSCRSKTCAEIAAVLSKGLMEIKGIKYNKRTKKITATVGSFKDYNWMLPDAPILFYGENNIAVKNPSLIVSAKMGQMGYMVSIATGKCGLMTKKELIIKLNDKNNIFVNARLTKDKNGVLDVELADNSYYYIDKKDFTNDVTQWFEAKVSKKLENADKEIAKQVNTEKIQNLTSRMLNPALPRVINGNAAPRKDSKLGEIDPVLNMTLDQKLTFVLMEIKRARPFYFTVLNMLERVEVAPDDDVQTAAVSTKELFFNGEFMLGITLPEIAFTFIHEVMHICLKHRARMKNRDAELWNIACDYYVNSLIADEFSLKAPGDIKSLEPSMSDFAKTWLIALPKWVLYNDKVDIEKDTPEKIYEEIMESIPKNAGGSSDDNNNNGKGRKGQGQGTSSSPGNGNSSEPAEEGGDDGGSGKQANGQGAGSGSNGQGNKGSRKQAFKGAKFRGQDINVSERGESPSYKKPGAGGDMVDSRTNPAGTQEQLDQESESFIRRAVEMYKQSSKGRGGDAGFFLERLIEEALAPKINWRNLLRNRLVKSSQKIYTYSRPDRRFIARGMTMPGPKEMDPDSLDNIKICVDTSGSISDKDLGIALAQIKQLLNNYKANAELLYWDTEVRAVYPFKNVAELVKCKPMGGGGTEGQCIFEYFDTNKDYIRGLKKKPSTIVVFTDGYIGDVDIRYKKKYGDTIWIISQNGDKNFKPSFGVVAPFSYD